MTKILIRPAKYDELPRIKFITKLAYKIPYKAGALVTKPHESIEEDEKFKNKRISILVAHIEGKIVGAVRYRFDKPDNLYFFKLSVLKTYRNLGTGAALIGMLKKIAKKKGCKKITFDCAKEKRLDEYYKKLGFRIDRIEEKTNHHAVYMSKSI